MNYKTAERSIGSDFTTSTLMSYVLRANYNYADKYLLTATARFDGSSKFAKGNRWGAFPSFSAAWNVTQEDFMKEQNIFSQLKLRVGYGMVGNQAIDDYSFYTLYDVGLEDGKASPWTKRYGRYYLGVSKTNKCRIGYGVPEWTNNSFY